MSNPNTFVNSYSENIVRFVNLMEVLRTQNDQLVQDPTIVTRYFEQTAAPVVGPPLRTDIAAEDIEAAQASIVQLLFAFDSGAPPQKAALYKMLP